MGNLKRIESFFGMTSEMNRRERGQILVLVALLMVGLLVAAGLAVDGGFLMLRKAQLDRAVDAAALAGAPVAVPGDLERANVRGLQMLAANGFVIKSPTIQVEPWGVWGGGSRESVALDYSMCSNGVLPEVGSDVAVSPLPPGAAAIVLSDGNPISPAPSSGELDDGIVRAPINYYCGLYSPGTMPGAARYYALVRYNVPMFFMPLIGINHVPLTTSATGEYYSMVDLYASDTAEYGLLKTALLATFGPDVCTSFGDPYIPLNSTQGYDELDGVYTFRIAIPPNYTAPPPTGHGYKTVRVEIFDPESDNTVANFDNTTDDGDDAHTYRVWDTQTGNSTNRTGASDRKDTCSVSLSTPDPFNPFWFIRADENRGVPGTTGTCNGDDNTYRNGSATDTLYRLYYQRRTATGTFQEVDLAYYRSGVDVSNDGPGRGIVGSVNKASPANGGSGEVLNTDLMWVSPGAPLQEINRAYDGTEEPIIESGGGFTLTSPREPQTVVDNCEWWRAQDAFHIGARNPVTFPQDLKDISDAIECSGDGNFIVNLEALDLGTYPDLTPLGAAQETPDIYVDPGTGLRYLYLDVRPLSGHSENGFQLWAGPSNLEEPESRAPAEVNARHYYIQTQRQPPTNKEWHLSRGLQVVGLGHLPMNNNATNRVEFPLAYLDSSFAGQTVTVQLFDPDSGSVPPLVFYFDTISEYDWVACYADNDAQCVVRTGNPGTTSLGIIDWPAGNRWVSYTFRVPSDYDPTNPMPFYGGRLMVSYVGGANDTFGWWIRAEGRPVLVQ